MTPAQVERMIAFAAMVLGVIGVFVSKRPTMDIVSGTIAAVAFLYLTVPWAVGKASDAAAAHRVGERLRRQAETPWEAFSGPHETDEAVWEVGIRRRTQEGVDLDRRVLRSLHPDDELEIQVAEAEAKGKARRWTDAKIGF
jgi:hypothetical protein